MSNSSRLLTGEVIPVVADRKVRPCRPFKYEWSPELDKAGSNRLRYWRVRHSGAKNDSTSHKPHWKILHKRSSAEGRR